MLRKCLRIRKLLVFYAVFLFLLFLVLFVKFFSNDWQFSNVLSEEEKYIRVYEGNVVNGLGAFGRAAVLTGDDKMMGELALKSVAMNTILSDRIPLDRSLNDIRHPACQEIVYNVHKNASVVIIFFEEPFSVILRTVWSVINRTPHNLLHEVILVDDGSKGPVLGRILEHYIETRFKDYPVKLIRTKRRLGLIRARLAGARVATGDIIVFLDAHCEAVVDWLEPLIDRIEIDRTTVAIPIIDVIEADTFMYSTNGYHFQVGSFSWSGHFTWIDIQKSEVERRKSLVDPVRSPTMAGGLFAIDRAYFWEVGSYDEQMDGWGGENLELSFRVWQCGGRMETVPCSRVGHVFRDFHPYQFPNQKDTHAINTARLAKVWMDEYANLYFMNQNKYEHSDVIGDLTHRKQLRQKLRCKPFEWYLKNVHPEKFIPTKNVSDYGQLTSNNNMCCDNLQVADEDKVGPLGLYPCHGQTLPSQLFSLTHNGELRQEYNCAEVTSKMMVQLAKCHGHKGSQYWVIDNDMIRNRGLGLCLSADKVQNSGPLYVAKCDPNDKHQKWKFVRKLNFSM